MRFDVGDVAGLLAGVKSGQIAEREANHILRSWGMDSDVASLLSLGVGVAAGALLGSMVNDVVDDLLGGLF